MSLEINSEKFVLKMAYQQRMVRNGRALVLPLNSMLDSTALCPVKSSEENSPEKVVTTTTTTTTAPAAMRRKLKK